MSEGQNYSRPDKKRRYDNIDYYSEPEAWVSSYSDALREAVGIRNFAHEVRGNGDYGTGDYEEQFVWGRTGEHVSATTVIERYAEDLLNNGAQTVNIVDFGAGSATTLCNAAVQMEDLIKDNKVHLIATNFVTTPTPGDLETLLSGARTRGEYERYRTLQRVVTENLIDFKAAHILELERETKGNPIHLIFMVNVFPFTVEINDFLLKKVSEMLDSDYGTLVTGRRKMQGELDFRDTEAPWNLMRRGANSLTSAGFTQKPDDLFGPMETLTFTTFQASKAPPFAPIGN